MDHIQMYLTHKKVPASLQLKIKKWAEYTWSRTKATDESRLLNMLPERLRAEVAVHVHLDSLKKVKIFEQCETGFLCELVLKLRSQVFSPGDYVCRVGETGREMFIINHGKVEVLVPSPATNKDMVVAMLSEGNYFGEISLLRLDGVQNRRTADVRSIGYSELLCLSRRDLMAALVEYPEAKSILEGQAKKRMKTNLQAQRTISVDTLLRSSQDYSSTDSGIASKDERGHDVSEIKAMIEELKNANKVPGKTVWQLIARCEVLQAKLGEKEKEIEDSKQRIKDLEQLLFSRHASQKPNSAEIDPTDPSSTNGRLRPTNKVTKQYSQDEGRPLCKDPPESYQTHPVKVRSRVIPDLKITRPSETSDEDSEHEKRPVLKDNCIKTSKITNVSGAKSGSNRNKFPFSEDSANGKDPECNTPSLMQNATLKKNTNVKLQRQQVTEDGCKIYTQNVRSSHCSDDGSFSTETSVDHQIYFNDYDEISLTTNFKDELYLNDSYNLNVHTIPEENEDDVLDDVILPSSSTAHASYRTVDRNMNSSIDEPSPNSIYRDLDPSDLEVKTLRSRFANRSSSANAELQHIHSDIKQLCSLDGMSLENYGSDSGIDFLRLKSLNSCFSDESGSRRNSWNWDSELEGDSDEETSS